jgi:uncharacterized membrane protein
VNSFGKIALLKQAWELFKKNLNLMLMVVAIYFVYYFGQYLVKVAFRQSPLGALFSVIFLLVFLVVQIGTYNLMLKVVDGKTAVLADLYTYSNMTMKVLRNIAAGIIVGVIVVLGLICLVIPGIYLGIRLMFFTYYIVDKNAGVIDSIKMSWELTRNGVVNLFLFSVLLAVLNFIGALLFGVGLAVTVPLTFLATALLYRKFQS